MDDDIDENDDDDDDDDNHEIDDDDDDDDDSDAADDDAATTTTTSSRPPEAARRPRESNVPSFLAIAEINTHIVGVVALSSPPSSCSVFLLLLSALHLPPPFLSSCSPPLYGGPSEAFVAEGP